jgi:Cu/Ag efflux pump CusA
MGANVVNREDVSGLIVVSANVAERDLGSVFGDIQSQIQQKVKLPNGYFIQYGEQFESEQRATNNLLFYSILAAIVIAILIFFSVKALPATVAIMLNLPLALVGGILSIALTGGGISIASLVGFITLFWVAIQNGLLLVDSYNNKFAQGMHLKDVIVKGSLERVNAILMTALTSALGMLPLAIVPFLYGGVVKQFQWLTDQQFVDSVAVAMITPGPVVITVGFIRLLSCLTRWRNYRSTCNISTLLLNYSSCCTLLQKAW